MNSTRAPTVSVVSPTKSHTSRAALPAELVSPPPTRYGRFSVQRIENMLEYCQRASWLRVFVAPHNTNSSSPGAYSTRLCPAGRTEEGSNANVVYWLRLVPVVFIIVSGVLHHFRCCLPHIRTPRWYLFLVGFVGALIGTSFTYGCSFLIGFPVPSNLVLLSGALLPFTLLLMGFLWRLAIRADPTLKKDVFRQVFVLLGQAVMTYAYAIYFFVFTQLPPIGQNAFTLMLPLLKLALKNYFSFMLRQLDDLKPAFVVLNVDVFSALYVVSILQASQSRVNTAIVLAVDVVQMAIAVDDLCVVMSEIQSLVRLDKFNGSVLDLCIMASRLTGARKELDRRTSSSRTMSKMLANTTELRQVTPLSSNHVVK